MFRIGKYTIDKRKAIIGTAFGISVFLGLAVLFVDKKVLNKRKKESPCIEPKEKTQKDMTSVKAIAVLVAAVPAVAIIALRDRAIRYLNPTRIRPRRAPPKPERHKRQTDKGPRFEQLL